METKKHDWIDYTLLILVGTYNLIILLFTIVWLFTNYFIEDKKSLSTISELGVNEGVTYGLFFSGLLGGAFYCLRKFYQRIGDTFTPIAPDPKNLSRGINIKTWFFWYLYRPIQGGVLALILLSLLNSNLISIKQFTPENIKSYYTLISIGFLSGFGSHELIHKIEEIIKVVFAKAKLGSSNAETKVKENNESKG
jgi:hypothetical protein